MPFLPFGLALLALSGRLAMAQEASFAPAGPTLAKDPLLIGFVKEALEKRPELAQARATIQADLELIPQVGALPERMLKEAVAQFLEVAGQK